MAEILPLKAWRYHNRFLEELDHLMSPLFDVISSKQREILYQNPFNSIHLSVPQGDDSLILAKERLLNWKKEQVIVQDPVPGIYVYYQYFRVSGDQKERCRKGFIAQIKAYDWEEKIILRHEDTRVAAVQDRIDLLHATEIQSSPTHGLFVDPQKELEIHMDEAISQPLYELEDYQGVREVLGVIQDPEIIKKFIHTLKDQPIILADGHHRMEASIQYRMSKKENLTNSLWKASDYHLMYLTPVGGNDLMVLPTHRLFYGEISSQEKFLEKLSEWFQIRGFEDGEEFSTYSFTKPWSFGLIFNDRSYLIRLKPEKWQEVRPELPDSLRRVDLVILHDLVFDKVLGINPEEQKTTTEIGYERNFARCLHEVQSGKASFSIITREIEMDQILEVCKSGHVLPQKSTYFYPKTLGGLLFASINQEEFDYDYSIFLS